MNAKEQGQLLRLWREYVGWKHGQVLTLEAAAVLIADEAERQGIPEGNRSVPRTHASLTRWELGNVQPKIAGLGIIAKAYGINPFDLMTKPPPRTSEGTRSEEAEVLAFRQFIRQRDGR
jgi:hypothetical protein